MFLPQLLPAIRSEELHEEERAFGYRQRVHSQSCSSYRALNRYHYFEIEREARVDVDGLCRREVVKLRRRADRANGSPPRSMPLGHPLASEDPSEQVRSQLDLVRRICDGDLYWNVDQYRDMVVRAPEKFALYLLIDVRDGLNLMPSDELRDALRALSDAERLVARYRKTAFVKLVERERDLLAHTARRRKAGAPKKLTVSKYRDLIRAFPTLKTMSNNRRRDFIAARAGVVLTTVKTFERQHPDEVPTRKVGQK